MNLKNILFKSLWWIIFLIPIVIYFGFIYVYAINIPYVDDHGLKGFIVKFFSSNTFLDKINAIFAQHNEHRIGLTRIILLIVYYLKNEIDYEWLIWIGNFFLLGIIYVFYKYFKLRSIDLKYLLPLPWLLFSFLQNENTYWGMASIQNFGIIFLCLSAFLALEKQQNVLTMLFISLAVFTSGNGFLGLGMVLGITFIRGNFKVILSIVGISILLIVLYFFNYTTPPATPTPKLFSDFGQLMKAFVAFVGSFADNSMESTISIRTLKSIILGVLMIGIIGICLLKNIPFNTQTKKIFAPPNWQIFIISTFMLIVLSALLVSWSRIIGYGMPTILTSRYKVYSILGLITIYVWFLMVLKDKFKQILFISTSIIAILTFIFSVWSNIGVIDNHYKSLITNAFNWDNEIVKKAIVKKNEYQYFNPKTIINQQSPQEISNILMKSPDFRFKTITQNESEIIVSGIGDFSYNSPNEGYFIIFSSTERVYIFPSITKKNGIRRGLIEQTIFSPNFEGHIAKNEIQNGKYQVGLISINKSNLKYYKSSDSVTILNKKQDVIKTNW